MDRKITSLGEIYQLAYVARDFKSALDFWSGHLGVGPFFTILRVEEFLTKIEYYGKPSDIHFSAAISYWGERQIEIITPTNDAPSIYRDWLRSGRSGLHHVAVVVDDLELARRRLLDGGGVVAQEFAIAGGGGTIYFDMGEYAELRYTEIYQFAPGQKELYAGMQAAARGWDASDPVRPLELGA